MFLDPDSAIGPELGKDEKLLWAGQPRQGIVFRAADIFMIPFSLMWGGFAIAWEVMAIYMLTAAGEEEEGAPLAFTIIFPLFGVPFVLAGLYFIFGRFIVDAKRRAKTFYGLTNQRIIVVSGLRTRKLKSLNLKTLSEVSLSEKPDRSGSITIGPAHPMSAWFGNMHWPGGPRSAPAFEMIPDAKDVYEKAREAQAQAQA
jgi:hypothetical protein